MTIHVLRTESRAAILADLRAGSICVACLCAAWCHVCNDFRPQFDALALAHPEMLFVWIDIEDQAEVADAYDVENFPTLLIQRDAQVLFFGAIEPDGAGTASLIQAVTQSGYTPPASLRQADLDLAAQLAAPD
jgi:thioredoxin 1